MRAWNLYLRHVVQLYPILRQAGSTGIRIDQEQQALLHAELQGEMETILERIRLAVPEDVCSTKRVKRRPENGTVREISVETLVKTCSRCGLQGVTKAKHTARKGSPANPCFKAEITLQPGTVVEYDLVLPFNPSSDEQVLRYVIARGDKPGYNYKSQRGTTVNETTLIRLEKKTHHSGYRDILQLRGLRKSDSTYVVGMTPNANGIVQTEYSFAPASGRLSSMGILKGQEKGINMQNIPHRGDHPHAERIRRMILPPEGMIFVEGDSSGIEAVFTAMEMQDDEYLDIALKGVHAFLTCRALGIPFDEEGIQQAKANKALYDRKKRTVHGVNYGMGAKMLAMQYPETFPSEHEARQEITSLYAMLPRLDAFHHDVRVKAHQQTYLENAWGYRREFWDVFHYVRDRTGAQEYHEDGWPKIRLGEDGNAAIAQLPQSSAGMFMKDNALEIGQWEEVQTGRWLLPGIFLIHDSYCLAVPPEDRDRAGQKLAALLTRPVKEMQNIRVGCEIKAGRNWGEMETVLVIPGGR